MKIVHLLAKNLEIWDSYMNNTDCFVNAYVDLAELKDSIIKFNSRDVLGFILYPDSISSDILDFLEYIDKAFSFRRIPVIIIVSTADKSIQALQKHYDSLDIYMLNDEDKSISDVDINNSILFLLAANDAVYTIVEEKKIKKILDVNTELTANAKFVLDICKRRDLRELKESINKQQEQNKNRKN